MQGVFRHEFPFQWISGLHSLFALNGECVRLMESDYIKSTFNICYYSTEMGNKASERSPPFVTNLNGTLNGMVGLLSSCSSLYIRMGRWLSLFRTVTELKVKQANKCNGPETSQLLPIIFERKTNDHRNTKCLFSIIDPEGKNP